jgi:hypothetical protein
VEKFRIDCISSSSWRLLMNNKTKCIYQGCNNKVEGLPVCDKHISISIITRVYLAFFKQKELNWNQFLIKMKEYYK